MRLWTSVALLAVIGQVATAQPSSAPISDRLTLDDAIRTARARNPVYLQTVNDRRVADARVRNAYAELLPSVTSSVGAAYFEGGDQFVQGARLSSSSDAVSSNYSLGVNYAVNGATILAPRVARANQRATNADIEGAGEALRAAVTQQYLVALQAQARAAVQDTLVATAAAQLRLAEARAAVGAGIVLDVRRAEVALGQAEVQALQARNAVRVERLRLFQQMGVERDPDAVLVTDFPITPVTLGLDSLVALARARHPALEALRQREYATGVAVQQARSAYTPTLSVGTGWGGQSYEFTDSEFVVGSARAQVEGARAACLVQDSVRTRVGLGSLGCNGPRYVFTPEMAAAARRENDQFPFRFQRSPMSVRATLSLPIFDNWSRELGVQQARVQRDDARQAVRARELEASSDVTAAWLTLQTAERTVALQETVAAKAREELAFAEERYRVGAATFLDVTTSRATFEQAQIDRVNAVYDYHRAFAALENAVGRPLR